MKKNLQSRLKKDGIELHLPFSKTSESTSELRDSKRKAPSDLQGWWGCLKTPRRPVAPCVAVKCITHRSSLWGKHHNTERKKNNPLVFGLVTTAFFPRWGAQVTELVVVLLVLLPSCSLRAGFCGDMTVHPPRGTHDLREPTGKTRRAILQPR